MVDFTGVSGFINTILNEDGANFAERFFGQELTIDQRPDFKNEILSATATNPLTLHVDPATGNLFVGDFGDPGGPALFGQVEGSVGEGAMAALFDQDHKAIAFDVVGANGGPATLYFFSRNGTFLGEAAIQILGNVRYAFQRVSGATDIAGFSIYNLDGAGIGIDNVAFD